MTFFLRHFSTTYYVYYGVNRFKSIMMQENPYPIPASQTEHFVDLVKDPPPIVTEIKVPDATSPAFLNELTTVDRLFITKRLRVKNVLFLRGKKNKFFVSTPGQNLVYTVEEENRWWVGYFCYGLRPLQLRVCNSRGSEVMRIKRPFACTSRVLPCQLQKLEVFAPPEQFIGTVEQQWSALRPLYLVRNGEGQNVFWIRGPYVTISCFKDIKFDICRNDGTPVGGTCKRWQGLTHALFLAPITDRFGVAFERELYVEEKALLLAATLLIDYMYYDA